MTPWDILTWVAIGVLGPGALIIFAAFLNDLRRPPTAGESDRSEVGADEPGHDAGLRPQT